MLDVLQSKPHKELYPLLKSREGKLFKLKSSEKFFIRILRVDYNETDDIGEITYKFLGRNGLTYNKISFDGFFSRYSTMDLDIDLIKNYLDKQIKDIEEIKANLHKL